MKEDIFRPFITPSIRTDLAIEAEEIIKEKIKQEIPGVKSEVEHTANCCVTRMEILDSRGEELLGKEQGRYVTIECPELKKRAKEVHEEVSRILVTELENLLPESEEAAFLVVGLGNWNTTPDALGPQVVGKLLVTRHLFEYAPPELTGGMRAVSALAPGVLGLTGIETLEIVKGVVERIKPSALIAVDALAARDTNRVSTTIQISDSGIHPGSGIGNKRLAISQESLGIPVLAIGVPTVVHALTIVDNALNIIERELAGNQNKVEFNNQFKRTLQKIETEEKERLLASALSPVLGELIVTPKDIDVIIEDISQVIAGGINGALHQGIALEELFAYTN